MMPKAKTTPGRVLEILNRNEFAAPFLLDDFVVYLPEFDYGIDFMLYREADDLLFKVQLKSRWYVDQKYLGRNIWVAFPDGQPRRWFLAPHDWMVTHGQGAHMDTASWRAGTYHRASMLAGWRSSYEQFETTRFLEQLAEGSIPGADLPRAAQWSNSVEGSVL